MLIAGHVLNKFKNDFDITQTPQEIAGFCFNIKKINPAGLCNASRIESITMKMHKVLRQLRYKRFKTMNDLSSMPDCHWYAKQGSSIVPIGNEYNDIHERPDCIYT